MDARTPSDYPVLHFHLREGGRLELPCSAAELSDWEKFTVLATIARWFELTDVDYAMRDRADRAQDSVNSGGDGAGE